MPDCEGCGVPYTSPLAAAECAELDEAESREARRATVAARARHHWRPQDED